jgi:hypothetical protein
MSTTTALPEAPETPVERPSPAERVTPVKLSEAMRIGALMTKPRTNTYFSSDYTSSCAIGAAMLGAGFNPDSPYDRSGSLNFMEQAFPVFEDTTWDDRLPPCSHIHRNYSLFLVITHLNDEHRDWTRLEIADLLEVEGF